MILGQPFETNYVLQQNKTILMAVEVFLLKPKVLVKSGGGTSPIFFKPELSSSFEYRARMSLPKFSSSLLWAKAFLLIKLLSSSWKLGLSNLKPGAYLLQAKNWARAFEPEPRLVPPLVKSGKKEIWQSEKKSRRRKTKATKIWNFLTPKATKSWWRHSKPVDRLLKFCVT